MIGWLRNLIDHVKAAQDKREQDFVSWCSKIKDPSTDLPVEEQLLECKKIIAETRYRSKNVNQKWEFRFPWNRRRIL